MAMAGGAVIAERGEWLFTLAVRSAAHGWLQFQPVGITAHTILHEWLVRAASGQPGHTPRIQITLGSGWAEVTAIPPPPRIG